MGVTIFDLFGEIFSENDMINFLKENGIDPNGLIGGGLAIRCFLLLKAPDQVSIDQPLLANPGKLIEIFSKISVFRVVNQTDL